MGKKYIIAGTSAGFIVAVLVEKFWYIRDATTGVMRFLLITSCGAIIGSVLDMKTEEDLLVT